MIVTPRLAWAVLRRPALWGEALRAGVRFAPTGWVRRRRLPLPPDDFAKFRAQTAAGGDGTRISSDDLIAWLKWTRGFRQVVR